MSESEILGFDPFQVPHEAKLSEEIERIYLRTLLASDLDVDDINLESEEAIRPLASELARYFTEFVVMILMAVYIERLKRGKGIDPKIKIVDNTDPKGDESVAASRIRDNLQLKIETAMVRIFLEDRSFIAFAWQNFLRNLVGEVSLRILEQKGDDFTITRDEYLSVSKQCWQEVLDQSLRSDADRLAFKYLKLLSPAELPFQKLQRIVISGLDVLIMISNADLQGLLRGTESEDTCEKNIPLRISGDGSVGLELPTDPNISPYYLIEILSSLGRGGSRNAKLDHLTEPIRVALGNRYVELKKSLTNVKRHVEAAFKSDEKGWRETILNRYAILRLHSDLIDKIDPHAVPDNEDGGQEVQPWKLAIEIAARESIPDYEENSVKADTLKRIAIIPPKTK